MSNLQYKLEAILEDVNKEDGLTLRVMAKITDGMFKVIKWLGFPFVLYLLLEILRW